MGRPALVFAQYYYIHVPRTKYYARRQVLLRVVVGSQLHPSAPASIPLAFQPLQLPCVNGIDDHGLRRWPLQVAPGYDTPLTPNSTTGMVSSGV